MSRSGLFIFENEPIWLIHDSNSFFFNRFVQTVSAIRDTRFGIGRTVPATPDTHVRLVVLVYCQARATPNDRLRPNAATTADYRVGLSKICATRRAFPSVRFDHLIYFHNGSRRGENRPDTSVLIFSSISYETRSR
jgi:hypothetical protein